MSEEYFICPRCHQEWLQWARLPALGQRIIFCGECEAVWTEAWQPGRVPFTQYTDFMDERGRNLLEVYRDEEMVLENRYLRKDEMALPDSMK